MLFNCVIFDLDGTLIDTLDDIADAANLSLKKLGLKAHPVEAYREFVGDGLEKLIERILPEDKGTAENVARLRTSFKEIYQQRWNCQSRPYAGINEMLQILKGHSLKLALLSNKPDQFTQLYIEHYFQPHLFSCVRGSFEDIPKKPDPKGACMIADFLNLRPEAMVFVGDSAVDIKTGKRAGMKTIGVEWGFRSRQELEQNGADWIVQRPSDIIELLLKGNRSR